MAQRHVVFFLGAGFSTDDRKLPVMARFGQWSSSLISEIDREWVRNGKPIKESQPALAGIARSFEAFREWCAIAADHCSLADGDLEDLSGMLEILEQSGIPEIGSSGRSPIEVKTFRPKFNQWIWMVYRSCPPFDAQQKTRYGPDGWPQTRFVKSVKGLLGRNEVTCVTTNYDIVLEAVAWREQWMMRYPMSSCTYASDHTPLDGLYLAKHHDASAPVLCKLHGSVNFASVDQDPFGKEADVEVIDTWIKRGRVMGQSGVPMDSPSTCPVDSFNQLLDQRGLTPAVVPPTYAKLNAAGWLKEHWSHAFEAMSKATHIAFIGYSLPVSDGFMHSFLRSVLSQRGRHSPPPSVLVIDPSQSTLDRYTKFFRGLDLKTLNRTLEHAVDDLNQWLQ
jgi:hypothetical protein